MLTTLANIGLIVLGFGILIFFHELGHFLAAKWAGIRAEAFAVGMGPVMVAYRKGIGLRFGSTEGAVMAKVNAWLEASGQPLDQATSDDSARARIYRAMAALKLGETEYSLRWLPIGGFVRMLGQEDANPGAVSHLPGSYMNTPVSKRMVVIAAGVTMNLILAVALFIWAFLVGVPFEAPIVGDTASNMPAANAVAKNAAELGVTEPGLQPGDRVLAIDGDTVETFNDLAIAAAMARPDLPIDLLVERIVGGEPQILEFSIVPQKSQGLLALGVFPASSTQLWTRDPSGDLAKLLDDTGLAASGVMPGMRLERANDVSVSTYQSFDRIVRESGGQPVVTAWRSIDENGSPFESVVTAMVDSEPEYQALAYAEGNERVLGNFGLLGLSPLARVRSVEEGRPAVGVFQPGDLLIRVGEVTAPRWTQVFDIIPGHRGRELRVDVLRDGKPLELSVRIGRDGKAGINLVPAWDVPRTAAPIEEIALPKESEDETLRTEPSPVAAKEIFAGSRIATVNGREVPDWRGFREMLRDDTREAFESGTGASLTIEFDLLVTGEPRRAVSIDLSPDDVADLHALRWHAEIPGAYFEPIRVLVHADGNPLTALTMGFDRTWKFVLHTYVTIDRLFRGSVGVDQLRGPVGIVHLGTAIADRGFMYLIFFLALISVNLAVINFLPLPIMDGGLFVFLLYEKFKGRPPSLAFQNAATIVGLVLIGALVVVTLYNDITRLVIG